MPVDIWAKWLDELQGRDAGGDRQLRILRSQMRDRVLHKADLRPGGSVVDLGCGRGFLSLEAARIVGPRGRVTAVDQSPGALQALEREAAERGWKNLRTLEADAAGIPMPDGEADAVVSRSVLSYVPDRMAVLSECERTLKPGGRLSLFEPVLSEEDMLVDWGDQAAAWERLRSLLLGLHPAFGFERQDLVGEVEKAGFDGVDSFTWHAEVGRPYAGAEEVMEEFRGGLPGDLSLLSFWLSRGVDEEEIRGVAERLAEESAKPSFHDVLPCVYIWAVKPVTQEMGGER